MYSNIRRFLLEDLPELRECLQMQSNKDSLNYKWEWIEVLKQLHKYLWEHFLDKSETHHEQILLALFHSTVILHEANPEYIRQSRIPSNVLKKIKEDFKHIYKNLGETIDDIDRRYKPDHDLVLNRWKLADTTFHNFQQIEQTISKESLIDLLTTLIVDDEVEILQNTPKKGQEGIGSSIARAVVEKQLVYAQIVREWQKDRRLAVLSPLDVIAIEKVHLQKGSKEESWKDAIYLPVFLNDSFYAMVVFLGDLDKNQVIISNEISNLIETINDYRLWWQQSLFIDFISELSLPIVETEFGDLIEQTENKILEINDVRLPIVRIFPSSRLGKEYNEKWIREHLDKFKLNGFKLNDISKDFLTCKICHIFNGSLAEESWTQKAILKKSRTTRELLVNPILVKAKDDENILDNPLLAVVLEFDFKEPDQSDKWVRYELRKAIRESLIWKYMTLLEGEAIGVIRQLPMVLHSTRRKIQGPRMIVDEIEDRKTLEKAINQDSDPKLLSLLNSLFEKTRQTEKQITIFRMLAKQVYDEMKPLPVSSTILQSTLSKHNIVSLADILLKALCENMKLIPKEGALRSVYKPEAESFNNLTLSDKMTDREVMQVIQQCLPTHQFTIDLDAARNVYIVEEDERDKLSLFQCWRQFCEDWASNLVHHGPKSGEPNRWIKMCSTLEESSLQLTMINANNRTNPKNYGLGTMTMQWCAFCLSQPGEYKNDLNETKDSWITQIVIIIPDSLKNGMNCKFILA